VAEQFAANLLDVSTKNSYLNSVCVSKEDAQLSKPGAPRSILLLSIVSPNFEANTQFL
jgi:hypothetical protein